MQKVIKVVIVVGYVVLCNIGGRILGAKLFK
jgi:hypothetical protein